MYNVSTSYVRQFSQFNNAYVYTINSKAKNYAIISLMQTKRNLIYQFLFRTQIMVRL